MGTKVDLNEDDRLSRNKPAKGASSSSSSSRRGKKRPPKHIRAGLVDGTLTKETAPKWAPPKKIRSKLDRQEKFTKLMNKIAKCNRLTAEIVKHGAVFTKQITPEKFIKNLTEKGYFSQ